jgi:uncharacterized C2H2 Zn-finger protein
MVQDSFYDNDEEPDMILSWSSMSSVSTGPMSTNTPISIDSVCWPTPIPSHDTSTYWVQPLFPENEDNGSHQNTLMLFQPIETINKNEHLAESRAHRGGDGFFGNLQGNFFTVSASSLAPTSGLAPTSDLAPTSKIMTVDELAVFLMQDIEDIMEIPLLNDSNAGTKQRITCPICNIVFSRQQELQRHINSQHITTRFYNCTHSGCNKRYRRPDVLKRHRRNVHGLK